MGRLFQYNRFGATENTASKRKKDTQTKANNNKVKLLRNAIRCPDYTNIYADYNGADTAKKNLDLAFQKGQCQQWGGNKPQLQSIPAAVAVTAVEGPLETSSAMSRMKDFLRRKLFATHTEQQQQQLHSDVEEPTSDYDEQELLDSSYHADAEEDEEQLAVEDCSCTASSADSSPKRRTKSPQKSLLSLNCWQSSQHSDTSSGSSSSPDETTAEDSDDAGISDCCQLLNADSNGKKRSANKAKYSQPQHCYSDDDEDEEPELLQCAWYQPRISVKAALEHLQQATPGSFLLRRSTPSSYELCVRLERKVKQYALQCTRNQMYCLKGAKKQFSTLKALITHHSVMAEQLPLTLDMPREQHVVKSAALRYADDFEPLESLQLLGILKSLQAKNYEI